MPLLSPNDPNLLAKLIKATKRHSHPSLKMTTVQRDAIVSPAIGLQIYNLTTNTINFWNGTVWKAVLTD